MNFLGVKEFYSTEKVLKHLEEKQSMTYNDEYRGNSQIRYDGKLINLSDGARRYRRDEARQRMYEYAEESLEENQLTFDEVKKHLKD